MSRRVTQSFFSRKSQGEMFLISNDFEKIKRDLQLPNNTLPIQLSELIIQQIQ